MTALYTQYMRIGLNMCHWSSICLFPSFIALFIIEQPIMPETKDKVHKGFVLPELISNPPKNSPIEGPNPYKLDR